MTTTDGFSVHLHNPNDRTGAGGCLVSGGHANEDCRGPWIHFWRTSTEFHASPYAVICAKHFAEVAESWEDCEVQTDGDPLPLRKAEPVTREETGLPIFAGVAGIKA